MAETLTQQEQEELRQDLLESQYIEEQEKRQKEKEKDHETSR